MEAGIGLYGLAIPFLFPLVTPIYQLSWDYLHPTLFMFNLVRFGLAMAILMIPTTLMGATLPVLASFFSGSHDRSDRRIGLLYALNTAGAVAGTFATGFILLPTLGMQNTTVIAVALNLSLALLAVWLSRRKTGLIGPSLTRTDRETPWVDRDQPEPAFMRLSLRGTEGDGAISFGTLLLTLLAICISGYTALTYEVAWTRILSLVLGSSIYAFTTMLTTFLLGIALGSALFTHFLGRIRRPVQTLAFVQVGIGLSCMLGSILLQRLPFFFLQGLNQGLPLFADHPDRLITALWFLSAAAIMIIPTLLFGASFPLVVRIYHGHLHRAARTAGDLYFLNTLGAIAGAFLAGFILIPALGLQTTLLVTILINIFSGFILLAAAPYRSGRSRAWALVPVTAIALAVLWVRVPWNPSMMTFNLGIEYPRYLSVIRGLEGGGWKEFRDRLDQNLQVQFYEEGRSATVTVVRDAVGHHLLKNDGRPEGGEQYLRTHVLLAQLPLLLGPKADNVLIIGMGTGVTLGSAQQHPVRNLEVIELEPAVLRASAYFTNFSLHRLDDPRLTVRINDGRNHLLTARKQYDIIISQPSFPWLSGVSNLFTRDFFELGASRLGEGGVFCQWISVYGMTTDTFKSVLKAFRAVFPHVMVFDPAPADMIFVGSRDPIVLDLARISDRMKPETVREDLERIDIDNELDLMAAFALGPAEVPPFVRDAVTNTDDNAWVEISGPRDYYSGRISGQPEILRDRLFNAHEDIRKYLGAPLGETPRETAERMLTIARAYLRQENLSYASHYADRSLQIQETAEGHYLMARLLSAFAQKASTEGESPATTERILKSALEATHVSLSLDPAFRDSLEFQAELYQGMGDPERAIASYRKLVKAHASSPRPHYTLASLLQSRGHHQSAERHYRRFIELAGGDEELASLVDLARKQIASIQAASP